MGQARLKRKKLEAAPCLCGSGKPGGSCCFDGHCYVRQPSIVRLTNPENTVSNDGCYLSQTNSCRTKLSREHLVSETVLKVIKKDQLSVSGLPWLPAGESKQIGLNDLVTKCLCDFHNSALSPLDAAGGQFFDAIQTADMNRSLPGIAPLVSGHDIERWLLKTLFGVAHSNSLASGG